jgi:hypothetical protein
MTREEEIKKIEDEVWSIFRKESIPKILVTRANLLIEKWIILTEWKTDNTPALQQSSVEKESFIADNRPIWQRKSET